MENPNTALTAREVCQILRELALGARVLDEAIGRQSAEPGAQRLVIGVDGWTLTLVREGMGLERCEDCRSPDGRAASVSDWQRYGTDPIQLLSTWEHQKVSDLLNALTAVDHWRG